MINGNLFSYSLPYGRLPLDEILRAERNFEYCFFPAQQLTNKDKFCSARKILGSGKQALIIGENTQFRPAIFIGSVFAQFFIKFHENVDNRKLKVWSFRI